MPLLSKYKAIYGRLDLDSNKMVRPPMTPAIAEFMPLYPCLAVRKQIILLTIIVPPPANKRDLMRPTTIFLISCRGLNR